MSAGAGWTYNNSITTYDSALYSTHWWNGRIDSLWAQAVADNENPLTTNGNRLQTAWLINDLYGAAYGNVFADYPLPFAGPSAAARGARGHGRWRRIDTGAARPASCRQATSATTGAVGCWPRFLGCRASPGRTRAVSRATRASRSATRMTAWRPPTRALITRVLVNFGKAIAAYEGTLVMGASPFDRWIDDVRAGKGDSSTAISDDARTGALLFVGKAGCSDCHNTPLFSDDAFHNVGVGQTGTAVPTEADCPAGGVRDCVCP